MEEVHGVDVSWLHHSQKGPDGSRNDATNSGAPEPPLKDDPSSKTTRVGNGSTDYHKHQSLPPLPHDHANQTIETSRQAAPVSKVSDKKAISPPLGRKGSWISSLSSKFSSSGQQSPTASAPSTRQHDSANTNNASAHATPIQTPTKNHENANPAPASPRSSPGFLQNALRRLSSSGGGMGKANGNGAIVPRKIMNVDPYRERCSISAIQSGKLRRVSFCVDVEIAGHATPTDEADIPPPTPSKMHTGDNKQQVSSKTAQKRGHPKDKSDSEALKSHMLDERTKGSDESVHTAGTIVGVSKESAITKDLPKPDDSGEPSTTRKKEKKKRSEEERKERKAKKHQEALANGIIPLELIRDLSSSESLAGTSTPLKPQDRPTIDPLRIYKRCCQLRETSPLKRMVEQLSASGACDELHPGTVTCLYLSGSRFQFSDIVTLGDYLAVVPVRKLVMDDCDLTDEAVRVVLAGLLAVKTAAQAKYNKELPRTPGKRVSYLEEKVEKLGVIEKICLKNNPQIGPDGWKHISCFINMSQTLRAIDLSMIPFPSTKQQLPQTPQRQHQHQLIHHTAASNPNASNPSSVGLNDTGVTFERCLRERKGARLEELVMAECSLEPELVSKIVGAVEICGVSRLGLASNSLTPESIAVIASYLKSGKCEGLDLGGNHLSQESLTLLIQAFEEAKPKFCALSMADTGLSTSSLALLLPVLAKLPDFRFIDLSHNRELFVTKTKSTNLLRRWLPKMQTLKRINLNDVDMESEDCISLAEVLPEAPMLAHLSILENPSLTALASASEESSREEACALYASLMTAARVSKTIISVDIDIPTPDAGEVVQALAKQLVAYTLRNLERNLAITNDTEYEEKFIHYPDILLHIVGHDDDAASGDDAETEPAPDNDYIVGGTGVAKALTVCLRNRLAQHNRRNSSNSARLGSGTATPNPEATAEPQSKAMSVDLLSNARKIRSRLQPAIVNADGTGDEMALGRLKALDSTLAGLIQRFEDEYPETRLPHTQDSTSSIPIHPIAQPAFTDPFEHEETDLEHEDDDDVPETKLHPSGGLSRHDSEVGNYSKHLAQEEAHMHRFGQQLRREIFKPQQEDHHWGTTGHEQEPEHILQLRTQLEQLSGDEVRTEIKKRGLEDVIKSIGQDAEQLRLLAEADPEA